MPMRINIRRICRVLWVKLKENIRFYHINQTLVAYISCVFRNVLFFNRRVQKLGEKQFNEPTRWENKRSGKCVGRIFEREIFLEFSSDVNVNRYEVNALCLMNFKMRN